MYRVLREHGEVGDRRRHAIHPARKKPELLATGPNQVYSWDITKLHGPQKWTYYYLYTVIEPPATTERLSRRRRPSFESPAAWPWPMGTPRTARFKKTAKDRPRNVPSRRQDD